MNVLLIQGNQKQTKSIMEVHINRGTESFMWHCYTCTTCCHTAITTGLLVWDQWTVLGLASIPSMMLKTTHDDGLLMSHKVTASLVVDTVGINYSLNFKACKFIACSIDFNLYSKLNLRLCVQTFSNAFANCIWATNPLTHLIHLHSFSTYTSVCLCTFSTQKNNSSNS